MKVIVTGAAGFIGHHLCRRLRRDGHDVYGVDIRKHPWHNVNDYDEFELLDCRQQNEMRRLFLTEMPDWVFALAADMGGAGYVFTGEHDFDILKNNLQINIATAMAARASLPERLLFTSSACVYPQGLQGDPNSVPLKESDAYPADPDSEYGWEKLMAERLYLALAKETGVKVRIARFHNIYGPEGSWNDGREKLPAAACRKIAESVLHFQGIGVGPPEGMHSINVWGDGEQRRSFCYIGDCINMLLAFMSSGYADPMNIGTDYSISVNELYDLVATIANISIYKVHDLTKPQGVRGRNADLTTMYKELKWANFTSLAEGMARTYAWVKEQLRESMD